MKEKHQTSMRGKQKGLPKTLMLVLLCLFVLGATAVSGQPKRVEKAAPGDCAACHGSTSVLKSGHVEIAKMQGKDCAACHGKEDKAKKLRGRIPLSHTHHLEGVACGECHEKPGAGDKVSTQKCLSCHDSYEALAKSTAGSNYNPHDSHYGKIDCDLCHHQHKKSENMCIQCHPLEVVTP